MATKVYSILRPSGDSVESEGTKPTAADGTIDVTEHGNEFVHITAIDLAEVSLIVPAGAAALCLGKLIYTFPAGDILIKSCSIALSLSTAGSTVTADTPDLGIGTVVGTGAVATLDGTGTFENILTGQTINDCNETVELVGVDTILAVATAGAHTVYLNIADTWAGAEATGVQVAGRVVIEWVNLS